MNGRPGAADFELVDMVLLQEEGASVRIRVAQHSDTLEPLDLPEGGVVTLSLVFRLGRDVDGLTYTEVRSREGVPGLPCETHLGSFRAGGPYEIRLRPERLPSGHASCGAYEVRGTFTDRRGRLLASAYRRYRVSPHSAAVLLPGSADGGARLPGGAVSG
ncbi:hypothetical protein SUDANB120_00327 [Streptomyces sp. enrichment culture]|uniref:hypothetical protein n=1 Tax=Streptomyces TaxID=1883 RepID=UPI0016775BB7|nr:MULTISPECIES: hypothetical protein [Streptomyces]MBD3578124.1 hypothetical protein [Streptomyces sp. KD18]GGT29593.1 hypothetical protein GCM10010286_63610 [Streptomyces toxytricini]